MTLDLSTRCLYPVSDLFTQQEFPLAALVPEDALTEIFGGLYYTDESSWAESNTLHFNCRLAFETPIDFHVPGLPGVSLVVAGASGGWSSFALEALIGPEPSATVREVPVALRVSHEYLQPMKSKAEVDPEKEAVEIGLGELDFAITANGIEFDEVVRIDLPLSMIGETGILIAAQGVTIHLGEGNPAPNQPVGWQGIYLESATLDLPGELGQAIGQLSLANAYIGSGGFTGCLSTAWDPQPLEVEFAGFHLCLRKAEVDVSQNAIRKCSVQGTLDVPFFDAPLEVEISFSMDGSFTVGVKGNDALITLEKPGILSSSIQSIRLVQEQGVLSVSLSGELTPKFGDIEWPSFRVQELTIDSKGHVKIDGGWLNLPSAKSFEFYGFKMELSKIGFGTDDDGTRWIGLSGGIQFVEGLPIGGSVEGLKIKWKGDDISLELRGIAVQMKVPNTLAIDGQVEFINDGPRKGFKGGVKLTIIPTNVVVDAQLMIGKNSQSPGYTFAYVYVAGELPAGIPLGNSGLALYGLAGLVGFNVAPDKQESARWFEDWYLKDPVGASGVTKWRDERNAFAGGLGATIGTAVDNGFAFHGKFLLVLLVPGPVLLLDGKSSFLAPRGSEPKMVSLAVFDGRAGTLLFNTQARYCYPDGGQLLNVTAASEAYFDFANPETWHLYVGMDTPEEKRVRASILSLYEANAYLMLDHGGVRFGARYGYNAHWSFGPLRAVLEAWVEGGAAVGWSPPQMEGQLWLHGDVSLSAFGFSNGIGIDASIAVKAPHPYYVHTELTFKLKTPWPLPDPKATVELTWQQDIPPPTPKPLEVLALEHLKVTEKWIMGSSINDAPIVPLDAHPVLSFQRSVHDHTDLAPNGYPSAPEQCGGFLFRYHLDAIQLDKRSSGSGGWTDATTSPAPGLPGDTLRTMWQAVPSSIGGSGGTQGVPPTTKLMLWSRSPFDYGRDTNGTAFEDGFLDANPDWPVGFDWAPIEQWADFKDRKVNTKVPLVSREEELTFVCVNAWINPYGKQKTPALILPVQRKSKTRSRRTSSSYRSALGPMMEVNENPNHIIRIIFPQGTAQVDFKFGNGTDGNYKILGKDRDKITPEKSTGLFKVKFQPTDVACVELTGAIILLEVGWVDELEATRADAGDHVKGSLYSTAKEALEAPPEILEPHKEYRLTAKTRVERSANGGESWEEVGLYSDQGFFRTASAPGLGIKSRGGELDPTDNSEHYPDRGPLRDLRPYVLGTVPDQSVCPVYRSYDIGVEFNEPYTETMYLLENRPLSLKLRDSNGQPVLDVDGTALAAINQWSEVAPESAKRTFRHAVKVWADIVAPSTDKDASPVPPPQGLWIRHPRFLLSPKTTYTAMVCPSGPAAIIPLDKAGRIVTSEDGEPICKDYSGSAAERLSMLVRDDGGQTLLVGNGLVSATAYAAKKDSRPFHSEDPEQVKLLEQALAVTQSPSANQPTVFNWCFTSSRFSNFAHHVQSWPERLIDLHIENGSPQASLLNGDELAWLHDVVNPSSEMAENAGGLVEYQAQAIDKILKLLGLDGRKLPETLTVTLLNDTTRSYGVLIESPEPLPIARVNLVFSRNSALTESTLTMEPLGKLISAGFAKTDKAADLVNEWAEFILFKTTSLKGLRLKLAGDDGSLKDYFTFVDDSILPEGTVVRIHSGKMRNDKNPAPEKEHFYAGDAAGPTERSFGETAVIVILEKEDATPVHRRSFLNGGFTPFTERSVAVLRSRDATRLLLFFTSSDSIVGEVPPGTIRIDWQYYRKIDKSKGSANPEPILLRMGNNTPESTTIEIVSFTSRGRRRTSLPQDRIGSVGVKKPRLQVAKRHSRAGLSRKGAKLKNSKRSPPENT